VPSHVAPNAAHAFGHVLFASRQRPFVQLRALTGGPSLQSQNQFGQSSPVLHAGPCTLLDPLDPLDPLLPLDPLDPLLPLDPLELSVLFFSVVGLLTSVEPSPPEQAKTKRAQAIDEMRRRMMTYLEKQRADAHGCE